MQRPKQVDMFLEVQKLNSLEWLKVVVKKHFFTGLFQEQERLFPMKNECLVILQVFSLPPTELVSPHSFGYHRHAE
jgi:hypothetical protein